MIKNEYAFGIDDPNFSGILDKTLRNIGDIMGQLDTIKDTEKSNRKGKRRICLILEICLMECLNR